MKSGGFTPLQAVDTQFREQQNADPLQGRPISKVGAWENFPTLSQRKSGTEYRLLPVPVNQIIYIVTQTSGETGRARRTPIFR